MKTPFVFSVPIIVVVLGLASCEKEQGRYELVRSEHGFIRLDKQTGEMIALNAYNTPSFVNLTSAEEGSEIDPVLSKLKEFPVFNFPGTTRDLKISIDYRWMKGKMEYRFHLRPYTADINDLLRDPTNVLSLLCFDSDNFTVTKIDVPLASLFRIVGISKKLESWQYDGTIVISKADFQRIIGLSPTWSYTDALDKALNSGLPK